MTMVAASKWVRVNRNNPCTVCGKPDWCEVSADGKTAYCMRVESDRPARNGGWLHNLSESQLPVVLQPNPKLAKLAALASPETRNTVYSALLSVLKLSDYHRENLLRRGLNGTEIDVLGYKTLPNGGRPDMVRSLMVDMKLAGVPGFALVDGRVTLCGAPGLLIPVRDAQRRILACQIRRDHTEGGGKYVWLSSARYLYGCSPKAPVHVAWPEGATSADLWVTEGPLKADIASLNLNRVVLAVAGVGQWRGVIPIVRELKPGRVIVAYDMDRLTNATVAAYGRDLTTALLRIKVRVFEAEWRKDYKGIDDLVTSEAE